MHPARFVLLSAAATLVACSAPAREPRPEATRSVDTAHTTGHAAPAPASSTGKAYVGAGGLVRLRYPAVLVPGHDFGGRSLMTGGWRLSWDGSPVGPGQGVVSFAQDARPTDGQGVVTEMLRIGMSRDPGVVATCGTAGAKGPNTSRLPNRMLGGHRWTAWGNGDAGMSQQVTATDLRTVVDGVCYALDRISYAVKAAPSLGSTAPTQAAAAARVDQVLASVQVGGRR